MVGLCLQASVYAEAEWTDLFNGKNLDGWTVYVGGEKFANENSLKRDDIFNVMNGVIHVYPNAKDGSPQLKANLIHKNVYSRYQLQVEYRWLKNRFKPRADANRDAGILFHIHIGQKAVWPSSVEMQMGDGKPGEKYVTGDLWVLGKTLADTENDGRFYKKGAPTLQRGDASKGRSSLTPVHAEKPNGEWNVADIMIDGNEKAVFYLNDTLVNVVSNMRKRDGNGQWVPLEKGQISLQAEWAELEYRRVRVRPLP